MIVITQEQLAGANVIFQKRNFLQKKVLMMESVDSVKDSIINARILEISVLKQARDNYRSQIECIRQLQDHDQLRYDQDRRKLKWTCWVVGGVCLSVGVSVGVLVMALK